MARVVACLCLLACSSKESGRVEPGEPPRPPATIVPVPAPPPFEVPPPAEKVVSVGRGQRHACVVRESGAVDCWGQPWRCRKDCDTPPPPDHTVRRVPGVTDAVSISGDGRCVLRKTGEVACLAFETLELVPLAGLQDVTAISNHGNCFLHGTGSVSCITDIMTNELRKIPNVTDAVAVTSTAMLMGCALRKNGEAMCGFVNEGPWRRLAGVPKLKQILLGGDRPHRACVMTTSGDVDCFELWPYGKAPLKPVRGGEHAFGTRFFAPERFTNASELSLQTFGDERQVRLEGVVGGKVMWDDLAGSTGTLEALDDVARHSGGCAIRAQGSVVCWGTNEGGALAQPTTLGRLDAPPAPVAGAGDVVHLALGTIHGYALTRSGELLTWGGDPFDPMPTASTSSLHANPENVAEIVADRDGRLCARTRNGEVWCHTEHATEHARADDRRFQRLNTQGIVSISPGDGVVHAIRADGRVEVHATRLSSDGPRMEELTLPEPVIGVYANSDFRCRLRRDHTVACRAPIAGITHATALAGGDRFGCALQGGAVLCWTYTPDGTDHIVESAARAVPGIADATDLATSREYGCAVHGGGRVSCFHFDDKLQLLPAVEVLGGEAVAVELGYGTKDQVRKGPGYHGPVPAGETGCAIMRDATVRCWGTNLVGETGDGSFVASSLPIGVRL